MKAEKANRPERLALGMNILLLLVAVAAPVLVFLLADGLDASLITALFFTGISIALVSLSGLERLQRFSRHFIIFGLFWAVLAYLVPLLMAGSERLADEALAREEVLMNLDSRLAGTAQLRRDVGTYQDTLAGFSEIVSHIRADLSALDARTEDLKSSLDSSRMLLTGEVPVQEPALQQEQQPEQEPAEAVAAQ